jgi:hypothetical protein
MYYGLPDFWLSDEMKQPAFMMAGHKLATFKYNTNTGIAECV